MKLAAKNNLHGITVDEGHLIIRTDAEKSGIKAVCQDLGKQSCKIKRFSLMKLYGEDIAEFTWKKYVTKALSKNTSLTAFEIDSSGNEDAEYFKAISANPKSSIKSLRIGMPFNSVTTNFEDAFNGLKLIDLEVNVTNTIDVTRLLTVWSNMETLRTFSYQGQVPTKEMIELLNKNQHLENVSIACYRLAYHNIGKTISISHQIAKTLAALPNIKTLKLQFDLSPEEAEALILGLKDNATITELAIDQYWLVHDFRSSVSNKIAALSSLKSLHTFRMKNFKGLTYFTGTNIELLDISPLFKPTGSIKTLDCYFEPFDTAKFFQVIEQGTCLEQIILQHNENITFARSLFEVCQRRNPFIMLTTKGLGLTTERSALKNARVNLFRSLVAVRILLRATNEATLLTHLPPEILLMILAYVVSTVEISAAHGEGLLKALTDHTTDAQRLSIRACWSGSYFFARSDNCGPLSSVGRALGF